MRHKMCIASVNRQRDSFTYKEIHLQKELRPITRYIEERMKAQLFENGEVKGEEEILM